MQQIKAVYTPEAPAPSGPYSQAIVVNGFAYTAGVVPLDPVTRTMVGESVTAQTHQVMHNLRMILAAAGCGFGDVVAATVHLQHPERDFAEFNEAYQQHFSPPYPVRTTVGSGLLGCLVEINLIASVRETTGAGT
jgi:2-iminobutanoate/2-iminopropanoate deaminase